MWRIIVNSLKQLFFFLLFKSAMWEINEITIKCDIYLGLLEVVRTLLHLYLIQE